MHTLPPTNTPKHQKFAKSPKLCYNSRFYTTQHWEQVVQRFFEFMGNHPFLFGLLAILIIIFFITESKQNGKKIPPSGVGLLVNNEKAKIIDIRPKAKFETGYIAGSENIPFTELKNRLAELQQSPTPLIIVCEYGMQAGAAVALIGKDNVYRLEGGIANWQASQMPLVKK